MICELISEKRPKNEQKVPQGKNGEDGLNWYAYVNNDPVNFIDPWGLCASDIQAARDLAQWEKAQEPTIQETGENVSVAKSWAEKEIGAPLVGIFVMADGANLVTSANSGEKAAPGTMFVNLVNPVIEIGDNTIPIYVAPLP